MAKPKEKEDSPDSRIKPTMTFEQAMKKALNTPLPKKQKPKKK